ncbi:unnamed protein product [Coffea canephora]|uniref:Uncharacterized protein n=2 Tax=Coffea TaxID=13442 RepID=A0A068V5X5_COFCA|nr:unnamed protein product [Coffea canephora]
MGGLTIACREDMFIDLTSRLENLLAYITKTSSCFSTLSRKSSYLSLLKLYNKASSRVMAIRLPRILQAKQILRQSSKDVSKGYVAVYVGESEKKRFVIPISYLNQPTFRELLSQAEEEFGFDHPMGGLTIPCREDKFIDVTSCLS